jgi:phosphatidylserine/phosphatidylglycerophosphate/cardiolipin synthase-like enzyme
MSRINGRTAVMRRLAALRHSGCNVEVAYADIGAGDRRILARAGVGLHRVCLAPVGGAPTISEYLHSKYLLVAGTDTRLGPNRRIVYTGSANLDDQALTRTDDRLERYVEPGGHSPVFDAYFSNFVHLMRLSQGHQSSARCVGDD